MDTTISGLVFDLDNTLLDREALFMRVAESFYDEHLYAKTFVTRQQAVAKMVEWDGDGYADRQKMLMQWLGEWPETGLDLESLRAWYRLGTAQHAGPDMEVNAFLGQLNDRGVPWGIVTNGPPSQRVKCEAAGLSKLAPFILISEEIGYAKPDPRIFGDALRSTGLSTPEQVMFVGGQPRSGHRWSQELWHEDRLGAARPAVPTGAPDSRPCCRRGHRASVHRRSIGRCKLDGGVCVN